MPTLRPTGGSCPATAGAEATATAQGDRSGPGLELGHHLPPHQRQGRMAVPLSGDRSVELKGGDLGCRRTRGRSHCSGSVEPDLHPRADQQGP